MKVNTISNTFSYFGNFTGILPRVSELIPLFNGYRVNTAKERLPDGKELTDYIFTQANKRVVLRAFRLDIEFTFGANLKGKDFIQYVTDIAGKLSTVDPFKGSRIAFSNVEFISDGDGKVRSALNGLVGAASLFGADADEVGLRLNHVKNIGNEKFNSIINVQDGHVTNHNTKESMPVIFINKDINTVVNNTSQRFAISDYAQYLIAMMLEAEERTNRILSALE